MACLKSMGISMVGMPLLRDNSCVMVEVHGSSRGHGECIDFLVESVGI